MLYHGILFNTVAGERGVNVGIIVGEGYVLRFRRFALVTAKPYYQINLTPPVYANSSRARCAISLTKFSILVRYTAIRTGTS